jgi:hypothetical protein
MAGVPGGASCLAPSTIGFGEDAEVGAEVSGKSGSSSCRVIVCVWGARLMWGVLGDVLFLWPNCCTRYRVPYESCLQYSMKISVRNKKEHSWQVTNH